MAISSVQMEVDDSSQSKSVKIPVI